MSKTPFEVRYDQCSTRRQRKLQDAADKFLAKSGFFSKPEASENEYEPVEAESIGSNGNLRPTWQGRA